MSGRILLTGFTPFGPVAQNPSERLVRHVAASGRFSQVITAVLPTEYTGSVRQMQALIEAHEPALILSLGVAQSRREIGLERVALNLDDAALADNAGDMASGRSIAADGPPAYWSTLPLEMLRDALLSQGIPVVISNHAGTFVCNHLFYSTRHLLAQRGSPSRCGFVHVPAVREADDAPGPGLPFAQLAAAVERCLTLLDPSTGAE